MMKGCNDPIDACWTLYDYVRGAIHCIPCDTACLCAGLLYQRRESTAMARGQTHKVSWPDTHKGHHYYATAVYRLSSIVVVPLVGTMCTHRGQSVCQS